MSFHMRLIQSLTLLSMLANTTSGCKAHRGQRSVAKESEVSAADILIEGDLFAAVTKLNQSTKSLVMAMGGASAQKTDSIALTDEVPSAAFSSSLDYLNAFTNIQLALTISWQEQGPRLTDDGELAEFKKVVSADLDDLRRQLNGLTRVVATVDGKVDARDQKIAELQSQIKAIEAAKNAGVSGRTVSPQVKAELNKAVAGLTATVKSTEKYPNLKPSGWIVPLDLAMSQFDFLNLSLEEKRKAVWQCRTEILESKLQKFAECYLNCPENPDRPAPVLFCDIAVDPSSPKYVEEALEYSKSIKCLNPSSYRLFYSYYPLLSRDAPKLKACEGHPLPRIANPKW